MKLTGCTLFASVGLTAALVLATPVRADVVISDVVTLMNGAVLVRKLTFTEAEEGMTGIAKNFPDLFPPTTRFMFPQPGCVSGFACNIPEPGVTMNCPPPVGGTSRCSDAVNLFQSGNNLVIQAFSDGSSADVAGRPDLGEQATFKIVGNNIANTLIFQSDVPEPSFWPLLTLSLAGFVAVTLRRHARQ